MDLNSFAPLLPLAAAGAGLVGFKLVSPLGNPKFQHSRQVDYVPWSGVMDDNATVRCVNARGEFFFRVVEVNGLIYSSMKESEIHDIERRKRAWLLSLKDSDVMVRVWTSHTTATVQRPKSDLSPVGKMNDKWNAYVSRSKRTSHKIIIGVHGYANLARIDACIDNMRSVLGELKPRIVRNDGDKGFSPLMSFLSYMVNYTEYPVPPLYDSLGEYLPTGFHEPGPLDHDISTIKTTSHGHELWHSVIGVSGYGEYSQREIVDFLLAEEASFDLDVRFNVLSTETSRQRVKYRSRQALFRGQNDIIKEEWKQIEEEVGAEKEAVVYTEFYVYPRADSYEELNRITNAFLERLGNRSVKAVREYNLAWRAFCSRLPGFEYWTRMRELETKNVQDLIPLTGSPRGNMKSLWGNSCLRMVPTAGQRSPFGFTFHPTEGDDSSPHGAVFARTRQGKTTWLSFLLSGAMEVHPDLRLLLFDRNQGLRVFTAYMDGQYLWPGKEDLPLNMFDCENTPENRKLAVELLRLMASEIDAELNAKPISDRAHKALEHAVSDIFSMPREQRNLRNVFDKAFPPGDLKAALEKWVKGEAYGNLFTGAFDSFDPNASRLITIAMDSVVDDLKRSAVMSFYFMRRMENAFVAGGYPYKMLVDESSTLFADPALGDLIAAGMRTAGKNQGSITTLWQEPHTLLKSPVGRVILDNCGTFTFFPGSARSDADCEPFGLTESETDFACGRWTPPNSIRPVLVKRVDGESVYLETDLSALGEHINMFRGGIKPNMKLDQLKKEFPGGWKERFLTTAE